MTEQQPYDVLTRFPFFEVRRYPAHLVAEVELESSFTGVVQEQATTKIQMTSPVVQASGAESGRHVVAFVMPAEFTLDTLPTPSDPRITVWQVPEHVAAVTTFTGRWTERTYPERVAELRTAVERAGVEVSGPPRFARFDPPWTPWFLRRNEVVLPVLWR